MRCPACDRDNLQGSDLCESCGLDLAGLDIPGHALDAQEPFLSRPVGELKLHEPILLSPEATVSRALEAMRGRSHGCVFVQDVEGRLVGVFTERDAVSRIAARRKDPAAVHLSEVMTPRPHTLNRADPIAWALNRMGVEGQRHLPILDEGALVGFLSVRVVLEALLGADDRSR